MNPILSFKKASTLSANKLFELFSSGPDGLSSIQYHKNLVKFGANQIARYKITALTILIRQIKSPFIYLLITASGIAYWIRQPIDALFILVFILINTVLGFFQEYQAERTVHLLKKYWQDRVKVTRDGKHKLLNSKEIVPGDVVTLQGGDRIPADVRFLSSVNLTVDESLLTGEALNITKTHNPLGKEPMNYYEARNIGFAGTHVLTGETKAIVIATSEDSALGKIVRLAQESRQSSSFEKEISNFSNFILKLIGATLVLVLAFNFGLKGLSSWEELTLFSIALTVGVIPEALPLVMTLSFSGAAFRMSKKDVIVKKLSAINSLGGIDVLCTDKTGTLTENKMKVYDIFSKIPSSCLGYALKASSFWTTGKNQGGNAFDLAILQYASPELKKELQHCAKFAELPFDPILRRNSVFIQEADGSFMLITRGAPEDTLRVCRNGRSYKAEIEKYLSAQGLLGNRVLAVAVKKIPSKIKKITDKHDKGYNFAGLISFEDPLKSGAVSAIKKAALLNVKIKIITGDAKDVSKAVGRKIGLTGEPNGIICGLEFDKLSADKQFEAVEKYSIFARMNPSQKYHIIKLLQENGNIVGYIGDGFNDAPSLKLADVALAVQNASDIAKDVADVILLKKNLSVIIDGIEEGRRTFANIVKYLKITLASNFGNFYALAIATLFVPFLPMLPVQILLVNLLTDTPMISIANDSVPLEDLKKPSKYNTKGILLTATIFGVISSCFDLLTFAVFKDFGPQILQTLWFIESVLTELLLIFSLRTNRFYCLAVKYLATCLFLSFPYSRFPSSFLSLFWDRMFSISSPWPYPISSH